MSYQQIARVLEIPMGTVRSRIARARQRLREELVRLEDDGSSAEGSIDLPGEMTFATSTRVSPRAVSGPV